MLIYSPWSKLPPVLNRSEMFNRELVVQSFKILHLTVFPISTWRVMNFFGENLPVIVKSNMIKNYFHQEQIKSNKLKHYQLKFIWLQNGMLMHLQNNKTVFITVWLIQLWGSEFRFHFTFTSYKAPAGNQGRLLKGLVKRYTSSGWS